MMELFLNVQSVRLHRKNHFIMQFDNGYSQKMNKETSGFEVHWEAFRNWFTGGSLSPRTDLMNDLSSLTHSHSPASVIDLTKPLSHNKQELLCSTNQCDIQDSSLISPTCVQDFPEEPVITPTHQPYKKIHRKHVTVVHVKKYIGNRLYKKVKYQKRNMGTRLKQYTKVQM